MHEHLEYAYSSSLNQQLALSKTSNTCMVLRYLHHHPTLTKYYYLSAYLLLLYYAPTLNKSTSSLFTPRFKTRRFCLYYRGAQGGKRHAFCFSEPTRVLLAFHLLSQVLLNFYLSIPLYFKCSHKFLPLLKRLSCPWSLSPALTVPISKRSAHASVSASPPHRPLLYPSLCSLPPSVLFQAVLWWPEKKRLFGKQLFPVFRYIFNLQTTEVSKL